MKLIGATQFPPNFDIDNLITPDMNRDPAAATSSLPDDDHQPRRRICERGCQRPVNVCLCRRIPKKPIPTITKVVILQHPHEQRHKLATVPVLSKCIQNCEVIVGRKLRYGDSRTLDSLYDHAVQNPNFPFRAVFLFPGMKFSPTIFFYLFLLFCVYERDRVVMVKVVKSSPLVPFDHLIDLYLCGLSGKDAILLTEREPWKPSMDNLDVNDCVLIAFDGTWKHAKEMLQASLLFLSKFSIQACLNYDVGTDGGSIFDSDLTLRKEPFAGCMSTMEAVARCLRLLEPNGIQVESSLIEVLKEMVKLQASFLKPVKPRLKFPGNAKGDAKKMVESSEFPV